MDYKVYLSPEFGPCREKESSAGQTWEIGATVHYSIELARAAASRRVKAALAELLALD